MLDLGTVRPGSTIRIPFSTFDKDDGSSITMTNFAAADVLVYKDGGTTERASTAGYTATTDFDGKTGKHLIVLDLADNTTSGFWAAGSEYLVAVDSVTVDAVTVGGWVARFCIGYRDATLDTTIAALSSQTSFTLTAGPAEDDALNGRWALIHDVASAVQVSWVQILDYVGLTKTVTLAAGATFTAAAGDNISIMGPMPLQPATTGRQAAVGTSGQVDANLTQAGGTNITASGGRPEVNTTHAAGTAWGSGAITAAAIAADAITAAKIADGAIDAGALAADALTAAKVAADVGAEIAAAVRTELATELGRLDAAVSTRVDAAGVRSAVGLASANLDTQLSTLQGELDGIQADTEDIQSRLPAALVGGRIDANMGAISGDAVAADNLEAAADGTGYNLGGGQVVAASVTAGVAVTTNNDKTGYAIGTGGISSSAFGAGAIDASAIAANAIGASEIAQDAAREIADEVLDRDIAGGASGGARNVRSALRRLRNRVAVSGGTATIYAEDDASAAWTAVVTTTAGNPVSEVDPV